MPISFNTRYLYIFGVIVYTTFFICIYSPGFQGSFLLDDFANLDKIGKYNGVRNLDTFIKFVGNGIAGPTGRPLSLLSFLLNGTNWPTDPYPFKVTNVILHGLNGFFLFLLSRLLFLSFNLKPQQAFTAALIATSFWLLHPFMVSTVLYVVQRMAMLSAFFSIAGLWLYCKGRLELSNNSRKAYIYMSLGIGLGTLLAILSKENGILLPLLAICIEVCIFKHPNNRAQQLNQYWTWLFLVLPSIGIVALLIRDINPYTFTHPFGNRNFNLPERLLTESRIVTEYLYYLIIPRLSYPGILNENIVISKSLLNPQQTFFCVILISSLLVSTIKLRKRWPFVSLAILFFFAGHVLESTTLGLELYFEHRNYLPAIFLFLPAGYFFVTLKNRLTNGFIIAFLVICPIFTYQLSTLWGNELALTLFWAKQNPSSSRAQRTAALTLENHGNSQAALQLITQAKKNIPENLDLHWHWLILKCQLDGASSEEFSEIKQVSQQLPFNAYHFNILQATISTITSNCIGLNSNHAMELLDILMINPGVIADQRLLFQPHHLKGQIFASNHQPKEALAEYTTVLNLTQNVEHGLVQVGILATNGYYAEALQHLEDIEKILAAQPKQSPTIFNTKLDYPAEIARIKQNLLSAIHSR